MDTFDQFLSDLSYIDTGSPLLSVEKDDELFLEIVKALAPIDEDEDEDLPTKPRGNTYGIGKSLRILTSDSKWNEDLELDDEDNDLSIEPRGISHGIGKSWKILSSISKWNEDLKLEDEDEDNGRKCNFEDCDLPMEATHEKYGTRKTLKIPYNVPKRVEEMPEEKDNNIHGQKLNFEVGDFPLEATSKKYDIGKTLKIAKKNDVGDFPLEATSKKYDNNGQMLQNWSKEEIELKMKASAAKLRESYRRALPTRHVKVLDVKDLPDLKPSNATKKRAGGSFAQSLGVANKKLQTGSQPIVGTKGNRQGLNNNRSYQQQRRPRLFL